MFDDDLVTAPLDPAVRRERLALLVAALRSGDYGQLYGTLGQSQPNGSCVYCVLGVMIEVAIANGLTGVERCQAETPTGQIIYRQDEPFKFVVPPDFISSLPPLVAEWYGAEYSWSGTFTVKGRGLDWWNDQGLTFKRIATMIESEYLADAA